MFGTQAIRLLRETWQNATQLAEELYAMFQGDIPLSHDAPITITAKEGQPPLTLRDFGGGDLSLRIVSKDGSSGGLKVVKGIVHVVNQQGDVQQSGGGGIPARVQGGSGDTYQLQLFENGPSMASTGTVQAKQLQINSDETIPAGTWVIATTANGLYFFQAPVWLSQ